MSSSSKTPKYNRRKTYAFDQRRKAINPSIPEGVEILVSQPPLDACGAFDKFLVYASSLIVVGSPVWFYGGIIYLYRKWRQYRALATSAAKAEHSGNGHTQNYDENDVDHQDTPNCTSSGESSQEKSEKQFSQVHLRQKPKRERCTQQCARYQKLAKYYGSALAALVIISIWGPHRSRRLGEWLDVRRWRLWDAWLKFTGFTVLRDTGGVTDEIGPQNPGQARFDSNAPLQRGGPTDKEFDLKTSPAIFAFVPHGIFPFGLAFACLPQGGFEDTWGIFRPVVATATKLFPLVRMFISWMSGVDASRKAVSAALSLKDDYHFNGRVGISPGGIAEMFETYPKPGFHSNDEAALLKHRNGIFKLALQHNLPIIPVYCFGATKMLRRVQLPAFVETLSRALKVSLCLFFGKWGLPVPFRQRLMYVMGKAIFPPAVLSSLGDGISGADKGEFDRRVQEMHDAFCDEIVRIFDRNKGHYGWGDKTLRLV